MTVRLYVGGLDEEVTEELLVSRFKPFGEVLSCEVVHHKPGCVAEPPSGCRGFAYVELSPDGEQALNRCLSTYNGCRWRGGVLRVERARPDFRAALREDWQAAADDELSAAEAAASGQAHVLPQSEQPVRVMRPDRKKTVSSVVTPGPGSRSIFPPFKQISQKNIPWEEAET